MWLALYLGVKILFFVPQDCKAQNYIGCYYPGETQIYVQDKLNKELTQHIIYHELGHYCGYSKENDAEAFAFFWENKRIDDRFLDFYLTTGVCRLNLKKGYVKLPMPSITKNYVKSYQKEKKNP